VGNGDCSSRMERSRLTGERAHIALGSMPKASLVIVPVQPLDSPGDRWPGRRWADARNRRTRGC
jgi:hypothetical protein